MKKKERLLQDVFPQSARFLLQFKQNLKAVFQSSHEAPHSSLRVLASN